MKVMRKIPTMFERDEMQLGHPVINKIKLECQWVLDGEGAATKKWDGTNVKVENGILYKRQKPKDRDYDEASYVKADRDNKADKWIFEAFDNPMYDNIKDGVYEVLGPKIQGNSEKFRTHCLISLGAYVLREVPRSFEGLKQYLNKFYMEGIVFHHLDGRMAKIKRKDFGLVWPIKEKT